MDAVTNVVNIVFSIALFLLCFFPVIKKLIWDKVAPVKIVKAKVVDKYKPKTFSKASGTFKLETCVVVFETKDKKLSFNVSEFSYGHYKIKEKGTLKYKGTKIISFQ